jgi:mannose/fructose-specific phosphotransferase system component IIA
MIRALVITHGDLGRELVRVAEMILGPVPGLTSMSNSGKAATDITAQIEAWLTDNPTDDQADPAGGHNLAMWLGFVTWRDSAEFEQVVAQVVQKGREAIIQVGGR